MVSTDNLVDVEDLIESSYLRSKRGMLLYRTGCSYMTAAS